MLPDIQPVAVFQYDTKWVLKVVYIKHLIMVICFHPSSGVWPASPASCVVIYSQPASQLCGYLFLDDKMLSCVRRYHSYWNLCIGEMLCCESG